LARYHRALEHTHYILRFITIGVLDNEGRATEDANKRDRLDQESGLLPSLAHDCIGRSLVGLDRSTRRTPDITIALMHEKYFPAFAVYDCSD